MQDCVRKAQLAVLLCRIQRGSRVQASFNFHLKFHFSSDKPNSLPHSVYVFNSFPEQIHLCLNSSFHFLSTFISDYWKTSESASWTCLTQCTSVCRQDTILARDAEAAANSVTSECLKPKCYVVLSRYKAKNILCRAMIATMDSQQDTDQHLLEVATGIHIHREYYTLCSLKPLCYQKVVPCWCFSQKTTVLGRHHVLVVQNLTHHAFAFDMSIRDQTKVLCLRTGYSFTAGC